MGTVFPLFSPKTTIWFINAIALLLLDNHQGKRERISCVPKYENNKQKHYAYHYRENLSLQNDNLTSYTQMPNIVSVVNTKRGV